MLKGHNADALYTSPVAGCCRAFLLSDAKLLPGWRSLPFTSTASIAPCSPADAAVLSTYSICMMLNGVSLHFRSMLRIWMMMGLVLGVATLLPAQDSIRTPQPDTASRPAVAVNLLPASEVDIPIRMDLRPIYQFANNFIDTLYTSPNYPNEWVMDGCSVRYQYRFVRGPMQFRAANNMLYVSFSGYYGLRGASRICSAIGNSPWTPSCTCGFGSEKPRRIDAGFVIQLKLMPDYKLGVLINRINPVPVDKCEVCFFGKDVTQTVVDQLKTELDASIAGFRKQLEQFSLRPYLQMVWDSLQTAYPIPGFGYLSMQPSALRISQVQLARDSMYISVGLSARPELKALPDVMRKPLPPLTDFNLRSGFRLYVAQKLPYDSLSALANQQVAGRDFSMGKGLFKKTVRIDSIKLQGGGQKLFIKVYVSKAAKGVFYMEGVPTWDGGQMKLYFDQLDYHIETRQWLLKQASYLMDGTIAQKLKENTTFEFGQRMDTLTRQLAAQMNRSLYPGVSSRGYLNKFALEKIEAGSDGLFIQGSAEGKLWLDINAQQLLQQFLK